MAILRQGHLMRFTTTEIITVILGVLSACATFFAGKRQERGSIVGDIQGAAHIAIKDLKDLGDILRAECARVRAQHKECEVKLESMQAQIDSLMRSAPVAAYLPGDPKANRGEG